MVGGQFWSAGQIKSQRAEEETRPTLAASPPSSPSPETMNDAEKWTEGMLGGCGGGWWRVFELEGH